MIQNNERAAVSKPPFEKGASVSAVLSQHFASETLGLLSSAD